MPRSVAARPIRWRRIVDAADDGAWNMAVDEALLDACLDPAAPHEPTLRLYAWRPACLSLGRAQSADAARSPAWLRSQGIDLVRRPTGGAAVLHEHERTYAVIGSLREAPFGGGVVETYARIARAVATGLRRVGIEVVVAGRTGGASSRPAAAACFATLSAHEITWQGHKLVGAAQLRRRGAFLQHGSIVLRADPERLAAALGHAAPSGAAIDLEHALERTIAIDELDEALTAGFAEEFAAQLVPGQLTPGEQERAAILASWKYTSAAWTIGGQLGERERCWSGLR